jgi:hypothetical protein
MLPRFAILDDLFEEAFRGYVQARSRASSPLSDIKAHVIHEGGVTGIRRSQADIEPTSMFEASAEATMSFDEIEKVDLSFVITKVEEIAEQFERQFSERLYRTLDEATEKTGLRGDSHGKPLTNDMLIDLFSRMEINFERSKDGDITIVAAPAMISTFQRLEREMDEKPFLRKQWDSMMEKKRSEFREREINRNLAG